MGQSMAQLEADYSAKSFSLNIKAVNPSPTDATGIFVGTYLQSITKNLAMGVEVAHQRPEPNKAESQASYVAKYSGQDYVFTANVSQIGMVHASYHHKVSAQVELATEVQLMATQGRREAVCTMGGKWDFRQACFRGQIDTTGRVSAVIEERLAPALSVLLTADLDHFKAQSKFGIGLQLEN
jgi:mitochondrial import receptor subunit TOM40